MDSGRTSVRRQMRSAQSAVAHRCAGAVQDSGDSKASARSRGDCDRPDIAGSWRYLPRSMCSGAPTHADRSVDRTARRSGLRSVAVGASAVSPRRLTKTGKAADPGQGVDERAAPDAKDAANRGLHGAALDAELDTVSLQDFRGPAPERSQFVRLCYKN